MTLEQQTVSLEIAKKLKELGVKQRSQFAWFNTQTFGVQLKPENHSFDLGDYGEVSLLAAAFTVAELGESLPGGFGALKLKSGGYSVNTNQYHIPATTFRGDTEADARGKMLIYLIENSLLTLP